MIKGDKPSGFFTAYDDKGKKVEGETRQCAHCQFSWIYQPGSGHKRGICLHCMGLVCGKKECLKSCAPFSELVDDSRYVMSPNGIMIKIK